MRPANTRGRLLLVLLTVWLGTSIEGQQRQSAAPPPKPVAEADAFAAAKLANVPEAWEAYLKQHPAGPNVAEGRRALDALLVERALVVSTDAAALEALFRRCKTPEGADKIFAMWDEASFQAAQASGAAEPIRRYLARFPKGAQVTAARSALDAIAWRACEGTQLEGCQAYLKTHPQGVRAEDARRAIVSLEFDAAKAQDSVEGYEAFLKKHSSHAAASARLKELLYERAVATDDLQVWIAYHDKYRYASTTSDSSSKERLSAALVAIERLMYASIVAEPSLKTCEAYLGRFPSGLHAPQVRVALEPLLFEDAKRSNAAASYRRYLDRYPQGAFESEARSLLDPLMYESAAKQDWHTAYKEYLRMFPTGANAEKATERLAWLKANPAVAAIEVPTVVTVTSPRWDWNTVFKETGGKTGFKVSGSGHILTPTGSRYVSQGGGSISRSTITVLPGGTGKDSYWVRSQNDTFCGGYAVFTWTGEDAGGTPIKFDVKVLLLHTGCPKKK